MNELKILAPEWMQRAPRSVRLGIALAYIGYRFWTYTPPAPLAPGEPKLAFLETLLILAITVVLAELLRPKPDIENARRVGLGDFQFPTATESRSVPLIFGRVRMRGPNVVWYGDLDQEAVMETVKTGLFSKTKYIAYYKYNLGMQLALCRGPGVVLKRVWVGEQEVFNGTVAGGSRFDIDEPTLFAENPYPNGIKATCDFYSGTTTQTVNAYLNDPTRQQVATAATPTAPRYSGTCYIVARNLTSAAPTATDNGAYLGNETNIRPWSFELERYPDLFPGQTAGENKIGVDCNPVNVIYELLTNTEWGFGRAASTIDTATFLAVSDTLIAEENGMSLTVDAPKKARDLLREVERQIDGVVYLDHRTAKWKIKLARADYDINTVHQLDDNNVTSVEEFTRGSWQDTTNTILLKFTKRIDDYKDATAIAIDHANALINSGGNFAAPSASVGPVTYPGIQDADLAAQIAWRDLRAQSYPLARAKLTVMRDGWDLTIGDVVAWTNTARAISQLPMRIKSIDYGELTSNQIVLDVIQDVYKFSAAAYGAPPATIWTYPSANLTAYAANRQLAIESPRAIIVRSPDYVPVGQGQDYGGSRVLCAVRKQGRELGAYIYQRNSSGSVSGSELFCGEIVAFMKIGDLTSTLAAGTAIPTTTISIDPDPDSLAFLNAAINDNATATDLGTDLTNLILIGDSEFALVSSAAINGSVVDLTNVYRGALDTGQKKHAAGTAVYLICAGASITDAVFPATNNVEITLRAFNSREVYAGGANVINLTMNRRALRPYPPSAIFHNGSSTPFNTPNADADGSGMNGTGFNVSHRRRDYKPEDELAEMLVDNSGVPASTEYRVKVYVAPAGANTLVLTSSWATGTGPVLVNRLLLWNEAAAGTEVRVQIETRHDVTFAGTAYNDLEALYTTNHDTTPTSAFTARFYLGGKLRANVSSNTYTAVATGTFTLRIGAAYTTSNVQVSLNGGAFSTVIAAGLTSGTFAVTSGDTIVVRHTVNETPSPQLVQIENPSTTIVAYGVMTD